MASGAPSAVRVGVVLSSFVGFFKATRKYTIPWLRATVLLFAAVLRQVGKSSAFFRHASRRGESAGGPARERRSVEERGVHAASMLVHSGRRAGLKILRTSSVEAA